MITCIKKLTVNSFIKNAFLKTYDPVFSSRDGKERTLNVVKIPEPGISSDWSRNKLYPDQ